MQESEEVSNLTRDFSGQLGKRTRYQVKNTSQLLVEIARKESVQEDVPNQQASILPKVNIEAKKRRLFMWLFSKNLALNDDVVLNQIEFENGSDPQKLAIQLTVTEQLTMLLIMFVHSDLCFRSMSSVS